MRYKALTGTVYPAVLPFTKPSWAFAQLAALAFAGIRVAPTAHRPLRKHKDFCAIINVSVRSLVLLRRIQQNSTAGNTIRQGPRGATALDTTEKQGEYLSLIHINSVACVYSFVLSKIWRLLLLRISI